MKKRFIICLNDNTTKEQDKKFIEFIKENKLGWWHWLSNTWLISDSNGKLNAPDLRSKLKEFFPNNFNMVFEFGEDQERWAGYGTKNKDKDMFDWLKKNWTK